MAKRGRKNKYFSHVQPRLNNIETWCRDGLIEKEICKRLGVSLCQFQKYKIDFPELTESLKNGKEEADYEVENALFKRALGYEYEEVEKSLTKTGDQRVRKIIKQLAPDVTAQIFWLKNRKPKDWRDKQDIEHSGSMEHHVDLSGMSDEQLEKELAKHKKK